MLRLAICDDDSSVVETIESYIEKIKDIYIQYEVFFSAQELYNFHHEIEYDAYILDIEMKEMTGLQLANEIRTNNKNAEIIFITSYPNYVFESFDVITFDFIVKPLTYERFRKLLHNLLEHISKSKKSFSFKYNRKEQSIFCRNIIYIDKRKRKAFIYTDGDTRFECNMSIEEICQQLDEKLFVSIRQGCFVNLSMISEIIGNKMKLYNGEILYIARDYKMEVKQRHLNFLKHQI